MRMPPPHRGARVKWELILPVAQCLPCDICSKLFIVESLVTQMVKSLPAVQETRVRTLGWKALLEKQMATRSSMLAWTEESGGLRSVGSQRVGHG